ncbi:MAG: hypothetical protein PXX73_10230 [Sideroxydans sp.]|nr:hypothetical protein [Sideroxydans sp.]
MQSLHYSIEIRAPKAHVHQLMLADKTYREWTAGFTEGSYYQGSWQQGAKILFLNHEKAGMSTRITEHRPAEFVSIEMLSEVHDGIPAQKRQWHEQFENYSYAEKHGMTTLQVDIRVPAEWAEYLDGTWPIALEKLKAICEAGNP